MIQPVVVDTNVVSYLFKLDSIAPQYRELVGDAPIICFMTVAELNIWALRYDWQLRRRAQLDRFLSRFEVYESDPSLCERWAQVTEVGFRAGQPISCADAWIAATALELDCPLVTHNAKDFRAITGLDIRTATQE